MTTLPYGFRLVGAPTGDRRLVNWQAAFVGHAACDPRADVSSEAYLSLFTYGDDFRRHLDETGTTKGYVGPCGAPLIWWDIDREADLDTALLDARRLASFILDRYRNLDDDDLLLFFSGAKGIHLGLPTFWEAAPSVNFHWTARFFAEAISATVGVTIDSGIYDKARLFRAPNSTHPRTGLHKRRLSFEELLHLSIDGIRRLASEPMPFDVPTVTTTCDRAAADWRDAEAAAEKQAEVKAQRQHAVSIGAPRLNRSTFDFIRNGADTGDRHRLLFSAAANCAEFPSVSALTHALLNDVALDSGLAPNDVRRQIECGLKHVGPIVVDTAATAITAPPETPPTAPAPDLKAKLAALWAAQFDDLKQFDASINLGSAKPTADDRDAAGIAAERAAIAAEGGKPDPPCPPAGARFRYQSDRGRPCGPSECNIWTWDGAPRWYFVADFPAPQGGER